MAFLKINGLEIQVDANTDTEVSEKIIGERKEAFDGTLLTSINNFRKTISLETALLEKKDVDVIAGLVQGLGENFSMDVSTDSKAVYSSKGTKATFARDTERWLTDGTSISSGVVGYEPSKYINTISTGLDCIWIEEGTQNLLNEKQATVTSSCTGTGAGQWEPWGSGAEITRTTSGIPWNGDNCLYLNISSGVSYHGVRTHNGIQPAGYYTFSAWLKGTTDSSNIFLSIWDSQAVNTFDSSIYLLTEGWTRYSVTAFCSCSSGIIYGYLRNSSTGLVKCYVDGLQLE